MNSIVLMGEILQTPEMRYTPDNLPVASLLVQFPASREEDPPLQIRVSTFGELAQAAVQEFQVGQQVVVEGQLHINSIERDGRTEKRPEINARRLHGVGGSPQSLTASSLPASPMNPPSYSPSYPSTYAPPPAPSTPPLTPPGLDMDELPF